MIKKQDDIVPEFKFALTDDLIEACKESDLEPEDFLPTKAENRATGWDVRCSVLGGVNMKQEQYLKVPLGIHMLAPEGWWLKLKPRSSSFTKRYLHALYGTIDETYPGELIFACQYQPCNSLIISSGKPQRIEFGDRIAQVIPIKRQEMMVSTTTLEELKKEHSRRNSERKSGFGSSGSR